MEGKSEHEYFSADNLIDLSKLCVASMEVSNTKTKTNGIPNILNIDDIAQKKSEDDVRSVSTIGTVLHLKKNMP